MVRSQLAKTRARRRRVTLGRSSRCRLLRHTAKWDAGPIDPAIQWWPPESVPPLSTRGATALGRLLGCPDINAWQREYWLKKPYLHALTPAERTAALSDPSHPVQLLRLVDVRRLLGRPGCTYLTDVDVTRYVDGRRESFGTSGQPVNATAAWRRFTDELYSVRLVHPQQWHDPLYEACGYLQEHFGFPVTCSSYLTPPSSQGYPPHFDDCEIFVLQVIGSKRWRLYHRPEHSPPPRSLTEFTVGQLGSPFMDFTLHAGDAVYFPRGTIHQAVTTDDVSLHVTFSTYQRHSWYDLCEAAVASIPRKAHRESLGRALQAELRQSGSWMDKGLPVDLLERSVVGRPAAAWKQHQRVLQQLPPAVAHALRSGRKGGGDFIGPAIDELARRFLVNTLPPIPPPVDWVKSLKGDQETPSALRLAPTSRFCARLLDSRAGNTEGTLHDWRVTKRPGTLVIATNVNNGRALNTPASEAFEVLPQLVEATAALMDSTPGRGILATDLLAKVGVSDVDDWVDLISELETSGVVTVLDARDVDS